MPGNEPSHGRVREPVTIKNGSICTQKHVYEHPWELVLAAYLGRFPTNPLCKQLANSWTEDEENYPDEGKQTYIRYVEIVADEVPWIVRKASGLTSLDFHAAYTVDHRNRTMSLLTKNITLRKKVVLDEECIYCVDPENPEHTYFEQTATLSLPGVPSSVATKIEKFLINEYEKGIGEGRKIDQELIDSKLRGGFTAPPTWTESNPALEVALQRKARSSSLGDMRRSPSQESLRSVSSRNSRTRADLYGAKEQRVSQSEAQQYLQRKFGLASADPQYFAELWKEEGLEPGDTIDRARLLVRFSEDMRFGELAGPDAAEIAMQEAERAKLRRDSPVHDLSPVKDNVATVAARLQAIAQEMPGGAAAVFARMDTDGSGIVYSEKLAKVLTSLEVEFSDADIDELIDLVSMSDEDSFGLEDWEEFISSRAAESRLTLDDEAGESSPGPVVAAEHRQLTVDTAPRGASRVTDLGRRGQACDGAEGRAPSPPSMGRLLLLDADTVMNWAAVSGWVSKQGRSRTGFKRRWCILVKHGAGQMSLVYYTEGPGSSTHANPNGLIPLIAGAFSVSEPRDKRHSRRKYPWAFQLSVTLAKGKRPRAERQVEDETAQPFKFRNRYIFATESQTELEGWKAALLATCDVPSTAAAATATTPRDGNAISTAPPTSGDSMSVKSVEFASPESFANVREVAPNGGSQPREFSEERFRTMSERSFSVASELSYHSADLQLTTSAQSLTKYPSEVEQRQRRVALVAELEAQLAADAVLLSPEASQLIERLKVACATR